jgi:hypothetical protein
MAIGLQTNFGIEIPLKSRGSVLIKAGQQLLGRFTYKSPMIWYYAQLTVGYTIPLMSRKKDKEATQPQ